MEMPAARDFGWRLKERSTSYFDITQRDNGQFTVVLNHALLRGVSAQMIAWWFRHFTTLRVRLSDIPGYEGQYVPAYLLWHPSDHLDATLKGPRQSDGSPIAGKTRIHIREAMQYLTYGWDYPVDTEIVVTYCGPDGWSMGRRLPVLGPAMMLRIHFKDVFDGDRQIGVHYHYEVVIGVSGRDPLSRFVNRRMSSAFGPEFFQAWHTHNVIEVGVFENFLPVLYSQADEGKNPSPDLSFERAFNQALGDGAQKGFDRALFDARVAALANAKDPFLVQGHDQPTFL